MALGPLRASCGSVPTLLPELDQNPSPLGLSFHVTKMRSRFSRRIMFSNEIGASSFSIKPEKAELVWLKWAWDRSGRQSLEFQTCKCRPYSLGELELEEWGRICPAQPDYLEDRTTLDVRGRLGCCLSFMWPGFT